MGMNTAWVHSLRRWLMTRLCGSGVCVCVACLVRTSTTIQTFRLVRRKNMPAHPASDWSVVRIYPRILRPIGPSADFDDRDIEEEMSAEMVDEALEEVKTPRLVMSYRIAAFSYVIVSYLIVSPLAVQGIRDSKPKRPPWVKHALNERKGSLFRRRDVSRRCYLANRQCDVSRALGESSGAPAGNWTPLGKGLCGVECTLAFLAQVDP
eukprot:9492612-Pyramimonas_sp.AAC.1